jgi:hypothetical protein
MHNKSQIVRPESATVQSKEDTSSGLVIENLPRFHLWEGAAADLSTAKACSGT